MPNYNGVWSLTTQFQYASDWNSDNPNPARGLFAGGSTGSLSNVIEFVVIATEGDATDFGDLSGSGAVGGASFSSATRGVFAGGYTTARVDEIQYVTIATEGNTSDFGDLSAARSNLTGLSNSTRGVAGGGVSKSSRVSTIATSISCPITSCRTIPTRTTISNNNAVISCRYRNTNFYN